MLNIFISYARLNKNWIIDLQKILSDAGHNAWFDQEITGGDYWWDTILDSIERCDVFVFALSPDSTASIACSAEFQYALTLNKPILPIMYKEAELPIGSLREMQYVDATDGLRKDKTLLAISRALFKINEKIQDDDFPSPNPKPKRPAFPFPPDPLAEVREQLKDMSQLENENYVHIIFHIKQVARYNPNTVTESIRMLNSIINNLRASPSIIEEAREALNSIYTPKKRSPVYLSTLVGVIIVGVMLLLWANFEGISALFSSFNGEVVPLTQEATATDTVSNTPTPEPINTVTPTLEITENATNTTEPTNIIIPEPSITASAIADNTSVASATLSAEQAIRATSNARITPTLTRSTVIGENNLDVFIQVTTLPTEHTSTIRTLSFSPDGSLLASGSTDQTIRIWDVANRQRIARISDVYSGWISAVEFSADGLWLLTSSRDGKAHIWSVSNTETPEFEFEFDYPIYDATFSPNGEFVAFALESGTISIYDLTTQSTITEFSGHESAVRTVAFSPSGLLLMSGGEDTNVIFWDMLAGREIANFNYHVRRVNQVLFNSDGLIAASVGEDGVARTYIVEYEPGEDEVSDVTETKIRRSSTTSGTAVWDSVFAGNFLVLGTNDGRIRFFDVVKNEVIAQFDAIAEGAIRSIAINRDGTLIIVGGDENAPIISLWQIDASE
jgi:WD40 repeat protein